MMRAQCIFSLLLAFAASAAVPADVKIRHTDVFTSGRDGYHTYRIPALETAPDGTLLAFAEARKYNAGDPGQDKNDIDLVMKRSTDSGLTWSAMKVIEDPGERWSAANPATLVDRMNRKIWLFYLRAKPDRSTATARPGTDDFQTLARTSVDGGASWSDPIDLTGVARDLSDARWRSSVIGPGGAIQDRKGRLIAPVWGVDPFKVLAIFSDDHGRTWQRGAAVPGDIGGDENRLVELSDGRILMDYRQRSGPHRWVSMSRDGGRTWSEPRPGVTVTPVACAIARYEGSRILWAGPKGPDRTNLVIRISYDEGQTYASERLVSKGYAAYSDLAPLKDKAVGVLWERGAQRGYEFITFTRLSGKFLE